DGDGQAAGRSEAASMHATNHFVLSLVLAAGSRCTAGESAPPPVPPPADAALSPVERLLAREPLWKATAPLAGPGLRPEDPCHAIKDPSVVFFEGRWHLFCTIRSARRTHAIEYLSFAGWEEANRVKRHVLPITDGYFCAPQVFWFAPAKTWYLVY